MQTLVVIPTYDEVENVEMLVTAVLGISPDLSVLVVDDASPDGTGAAVDAARPDVARTDRAPVSRPAKGGHGSAYRQGWIQALATGRHDALFVMDCDFSHDPAAIPELLAALGAADVGDRLPVRSEAAASSVGGRTGTS